MKESLETVMKIHKKNEPGDILVFLTSAEDCDSLTETLEEKSAELSRRAQEVGVRMNKMKVYRLYGSLPVQDQMKVFENTNKHTRKGKQSWFFKKPFIVILVICATNIAETSLTLPGIVHVIDAGFVKISAYNPNNGLDSTVVVPVSQAGANQRAGRAGRVRSGCCYRLYCQKDFDQLKEANEPEMRRSELSSTILR